RGRCASTPAGDKKRTRRDCLAGVPTLNASLGFIGRSCLSATLSWLDRREMHSGAPSDSAIIGLTSQTDPWQRISSVSSQLKYGEEPTSTQPGRREALYHCATSRE